jgi:3-hydroxy-9,10-secoandrosta-1,3,5(10)-triene-9,17-dione monooxygenase reductase component
MQSPSTSVDARELRNVLGQFCTGVVVATGCVEGKPAGFAAQSFSSVSLDPPLVLLCPAKSSTSWPKLRQAGSFCINILAADQKPVCDVFARSGIDKFAALPWRTGVTGAPILDGVLAYVDCDLYQEHDAGDHTLVLGLVRKFEILDPTGLPLLFFRGAYGHFEGVRR